MSASVLIIQSDPAVGERIGQLILAGTPNAAVGLVATPQDGIASLDHYADLDLCITEVYFTDGDGLAFLAAIRAKFRHTRVIIVSNYNLQNYEDYIQGITVFRLPLDESVFATTCQDALATLEGHEFPPFRLGKKQPPDRWGDCYAAYDTGVKRDIFITICHAYATPEDAARFRNTATMMARAGHPNVQAVYQAGVYQSRDFFCREKWDTPNLSEMAAAGQTIDPRLAAQIIRIVGGGGDFLGRERFSAHDSRCDGRVGFAAGRDQGGQLCRSHPAGNGARDVRSLRAGPCGRSAPAAGRPGSLQRPRSHCEAPRRARSAGPGGERSADDRQQPRAGTQIAVTQEHHVAQQAIQIERRNQKRNQFIMGGVFALIVVIVGGVFYSRLDPPSHDYKEMIAIPSGAYVYQNESATMDHTYYIDKYEVTFGQYLKFLRAVAKADNDNAWRNPAQPVSKSIDHEPKDWDNIFQCIKRRLPYNKVDLNLDTRCSTSIGTTRRLTPSGPASACPTSTNGNWRRAARTGSFTLGETNWSPRPTPLCRCPAPARDSVPTHVYLVVDQMPDDKSPYGVYGHGRQRQRMD